MISFGTFLNLPFIVPCAAGFFGLGFAWFLHHASPTRNVTYRRFSLLFFSVGVWSITTAFYNALSVHYFVFLVLPLWTGAFVMPLFLIAFLNFPNERDVVSFSIKIVAWFGALAIIALLTAVPRAFYSDVILVNGLPFPVIGPLFYLFVLYYVLYFVASFFFVLQIFLQSKGRFRAQMVSGILGAVISVFGVFITVLFPQLIGYPLPLFWAGPVFTVIAIVSLTYMVVEMQKVGVRLFPIVALAFVLIFSLVGEMVLADSLGLSVFAGIILAGTMLLTVFLIRDILIQASDRFRLQSLLRNVEKANEELRRQDEVKNEFLSIASHHLRTPLTLIKWTLTELLEGNYGALSSRQKNLFHELAVRNEQLVRFVHSLLDVSKIEAGTIELHRQEIAFAPFLVGVVSGFSRLAEEHGVSITFDIPDSLPAVSIDPESMKRVYENIIENAIIYNKKGGKVHISAREEGASLVVIIEDTGIGIGKGHITRVGEKFFRSPSAKKHAAEGTGLGVFSARQILLLHGGDLSVRSEKGKGTQVEVRVPLQK